MRQFTRGERAKLSDLAAIGHIWEVGIGLDAPAWIIDFCCLGLDVNGQVVEDAYLISYNQPDAPNGAISLQNASNNEARFTLHLDRLAPFVRRLVFTATLNQPQMPGGILGAAVSILGGIDTEIGSGQLTLATPALECGFFGFSGADFGQESTLIIGELYFRDEWRFVAAGQPLRGELSAFLQTLTDGPMMPPAPKPAPVQPVAAPPRPARSASWPPPAPPVKTSVSTRPSAPVVAAPVAVPTPPRDLAPVKPAVPTPIPTPVSTPATPNYPQTLAPGAKLQDLIDAASPGATLSLMRDEYEGPIVLSQPISLLCPAGREAALWAKRGPVVTVKSAGVRLENLDVEVTVSQGDDGDAGLALRVDAPDVKLENVRIRGRTRGLGAEDGEWTLPESLDLGRFAARAANEFRFWLEVPVPVKLSSPVEGIAVSPPEIGAGLSQVTLWVRDVAPETLIVGSLEVKSARLVRTILLRGSASSEVVPRLAVQL